MLNKTLQCLRTRVPSVAVSDFVLPNGVSVPIAVSFLRRFEPKLMSGEPAYLITYHRCSAQKRELHKGSSDDSWESSSEHVSDTSSVSAHVDLGYDLVTDVQQIP